MIHPKNNNAYVDGLNHKDVSYISTAIEREAYWLGWYKTALKEWDKNFLHLRNEKKFDYLAYHAHPFLGQPEIEERWVPCNIEGIPMIKWGSYCFEKYIAKATLGCKYLAENIRGTRFVIIDCDGNHNTGNNKTVNFLQQISFETNTHKITNPNDHRSFHLTFSTDKILPTLHFQEAHIDIIGNRTNSIRYFKNKQWNGQDVKPMNNEIWERIINYATKERG